MADEQASINAFFVRHGLDPLVRLDCHEYLVKHFPGQSIIPTHTQGYCSYTVLIGNSLIVQFRPSKYRLNLRIADAAKLVYGCYAPSTVYLGSLEPHGLMVYTMEMLRGLSYKDFMAIDLPPLEAAKFRLVLCEDFARFLARAWRYSGNLCLPTGVIGPSIQTRLEKLGRDLPHRFRPSALHVLSQLKLLDALPNVLVHGDIVPSNIMLDLKTGHLVGLVDWAEAESLPFGICLYGLEDILGYMDVAHSRFIYHPDAELARRAFWTRLQEEIPELADRHIMVAVCLARLLGILLWHGFAFDDGSINRVVQEGRDRPEIIYLDTLLNGRLWKL